MYEWIKYTGEVSSVESGGSPKAEYNGSKITWLDSVIEEQRGTAVTPMTDDTAGVIFFQMYSDCGATSGSARGIYNRLYITGAGGGGESLRSFTSVQNVVGETAHGAHISLNFGASGRVTGQGIAGRFTLHLPTTAIPAGNVTYAAIQAEIYSDGSASDPTGNLISIFNVGNNGDSGGQADVDDDCVLFDFRGWTAGSGHLIGVTNGNEPTWTGKTCLLKCRLPDGTAFYLVSILL